MCAREVPADSVSAVVGGAAWVAAEGQTDGETDEAESITSLGNGEALSAAAEALPVPAEGAEHSSSCKTDADDPATRFHPSQLAFPSLAIALGGAGVRNHLIDTSAEREHRFTFDDKLQYVPIGAYVLLGFVPGVKHRHNIGERFLAGATAYVTMTAVCQVAKHTIREPRPDSGNLNSFPSGHTATAFCGAELCRLEYGNAYGAVAYAFAATTGVMRIVNNRHWCNDVLAGAGIGFLSAHVGYWLLPWEKRLCQRVFHRKKHKSLNNSYNTNASGADGGSSSTPFILAPSYDYETRTPSLSFSMRF